MRWRGPSGACRAEAEAGGESQVLKVGAQARRLFAATWGRGTMMGCEADGGTDVADVPSRLQGRSVEEEGCKTGGGQLAPGAVAASSGCGQELGGGCGQGHRPWTQGRWTDRGRCARRRVPAAD